MDWVEHTLGPVYNMQFDARSSHVLVVTELFNIVVKNRVLALK